MAEAVDLFATSRAGDGGELLDQFGLAERRRSAFSSLSGGERQRLFLVLALLNRPRLVILDELTQGLDPAARRNVWAAIRQLHEDGTTVLLVTHEMDEAEALCDRIVVMRAGRVARRRHARRAGGPSRPQRTGLVQPGRTRCRGAAGGDQPAGRRARRAGGRRARSPWTATGALSRTSAPSWCGTGRCPRTWACTCPTSRTRC